MVGQLLVMLVVFPYEWQATTVVQIKITIECCVMIFFPIFYTGSDRIKPHDFSNTLAHLAGQHLKSDMLIFFVNFGDPKTFHPEFFCLFVFLHLHPL